VFGARPVTDPLPEANGTVEMPPGGNRITDHAATSPADRRLDLERPHVPRLGGGEPASGSM
jgi:hypothetical protein